MAKTKDFTEMIKNTLEKINKDSEYKWTVKMLSNSIRMTNSYIKGQYKMDYFTILINDEGTHMMGPNGELDGWDVDELGSLERCVRLAMWVASDTFDMNY